MKMNFKSSFLTRATTSTVRGGQKTVLNKGFAKKAGPMAKWAKRTGPGAKWAKKKGM